MRRAPTALLICGSLNQTTQMHQIGAELRGLDCSYSPYFADPPLAWLKPLGVLDHTILAGRFRQRTEEYLRDHGLPVDDGGRARAYDLVLTCSDLVVPRRARRGTLVLVQEGMTDPDGLATRLVRALPLPLWLASTSATGLSLAYQMFCVASEGYRERFESRGIPGERLVVTGIPNFDDCARFLRNDLPDRGYVLVATSDTRETFRRDDRRAFIRRARRIAAGRALVFKLHPNEVWERSEREIREEAPEALVLREGRAEHLVANCEVLVTQYSTLAYVGLALGKECHSELDLGELRRLLPMQNGGRSAAAIARACEALLEGRDPHQAAAIALLDPDQRRRSA